MAVLSRLATVETSLVKRQNMALWLRLVGGGLLRAARETAVNASGGKTCLKLSGLVQEGRALYV